MLSISTTSRLKIAAALLTLLLCRYISGADVKVSVFGEGKVIIPGSKVVVYDSQKKPYGTYTVDRGTGVASFWLESKEYRFFGCDGADYLPKLKTIDITAQSEFEI